MTSTVYKPIPGPQGPQGLQGDEGPQGPQGEVGPQGPAGLLQLGTTLFVSKAFSGIEAGTPEAPFTTIQAALDAIGDATDLAGFLQPYTILVSPGHYDEDLLIPKSRILSILGLGTWTLGTGTGNGFSSTPGRNITFQPDAPIFGASNIRPGLTIGVANPADVSSTFLSVGHGCHISGNIIIADTGGTSHTLNLMGVKVWGGILKTVNVALTNLQMYRCYIVGAVNMPTGSTLFNIAESCEFDSLITVSSYSRMVHCEIVGMTVTGIGNAIPPCGMFACQFSGVFTGPANSLRLDSVTDFLFTQSGASLAGGATKVLLG